jgi:hypothetical protein
VSKLADFLTKNTIKPSGILPLVHTTPSYHLRDIKSQNKLIATECKVFKPDKLNYFFVGRPAYKYASDSSESPFWELPCCFIFDFAAAKSIRRLFPFDSGAFEGKRYPTYIRTFDLTQFEAAAAKDATSRIIGAFFGDVMSYFHLKAKSEDAFKAEFDPTVFDAELLALHKLSCESSPTSFDDRRFTIEIQTDQDVDLTVERPLAVVVPLPYLEDKGFVSHIETTWRAVPISYPVYKFNVASYYYAIYERVEKFFSERHLL